MIMQKMALNNTGVCIKVYYVAINEADRCAENARAIEKRSALIIIAEDYLKRWLFL
ncbi:MAG: hypothetical protein LKG53_01315 [Lachnospiraceae bacterium]|jgi:hypothetical protein|nr:hypothetical protein [Lachnospiraceae bacterium]